MNVPRPADVMRVGGIAALFGLVWVERCHARGDALTSPRVMVGLAGILAAAVLLLLGKSASKVREWSFLSLLFGFVIALCVNLVVTLVVVGVLRNRRPAVPGRAPAAAITDRDLDLEMRRRAALAVEEAEARHGLHLDYRPESVENVETILGAIHEGHRASPLPEIELTRGALKWGAYVGEVFRRVRPGRWAVDSGAGGPGSFPLVYDGGECFPVRWCYKRIVNGEEDNVWFKFRMTVSRRLDPNAAGAKVDGSGQVGLSPPD